MVEAGRGAVAPSSVPGWALGAGARVGRMLPVPPALLQHCPQPPRAERGRVAGVRHRITALGLYAAPKHQRL